MQATSGDFCCVRVCICLYVYRLTTSFYLASSCVTILSPCMQVTRGDIFGCRTETRFLGPEVLSWALAGEYLATSRELARTLIVMFIVCVSTV